MKTTTSLKPLISGLLLAAAVLTSCGGGSGVYPTSAPPANPALVPPDAPKAADLVPPTTPATPTTPSQSAKTTNEQIAEAERSGKYPTLDRSSDIAGPDANKNGVRDDIEAWINTLNVTEPQRKALIQKAASLQHTLLVDLKNKAELENSGKQLAASSRCGLLTYPDYRVFSKLAGRIESMTANTKERALRYMQYNAAMSGGSTTSPRGNICDP